jgi:signal recognition particle receptor subunit beta
MADFEEASNTLTAKLVYYGPALSGKTTNLTALHDRLQARTAGELMVFDTKGDRTLFFDLLPLRFRAAGGLTIRLKVFTVPGQVAHDATRKAVLSRADGVVFIADSQSSQSVNNFESFRNLEENAYRVGLDFENLPLVIQYNKRDLAETVSESEVLGRWRETGIPVVFASALYGKGVGETFEALLGLLHASLNRELDTEARWGLTRGDLVKQATGMGQPG